MTLLDDLRAWARQRETRESGLAIWIGLLLAVLLVMPARTPRAGELSVLFLLGLVLAVALRYRIGFVAIGVLVLAGLQLRVLNIGVGFSDVLAVTDLAIDRFLAGENPYGVGYPNSTPPGAPFAYGPLALVWYALTPDPRRFELLVSFLILGALAVRGRPIGLAVYALGPTLVSTASDGSNDTSAGLFLLVALVIALRRPSLGGLLLAGAAAFKPYAAAWLIPLVAWAGVGPLIGFVAGSLATWGPVLLFWGLPSVLESFRLADAIHARPSYSLAALLESGSSRVSPAVFGLLRIVVGGVLSVTSLLLVRSGRGVVLMGTIVYLGTLYTGFWSTFAYLSAVAPVICWHLDDWLGLGEQRVRWPGDPVGSLTDAIDRRWPRRGDGQALAQVEVRQRGSGT